MFYKCHNCDAGKTFGGLLKIVDSLLYPQYVMERYQEGVAGPRANKEPEFKFEQPNFSGRNTSRLIDSIMDRVDKLHEQCDLTDSNHIAVDYCRKRRIPIEKWDRLYHIEDISKIHQLAPKYKDRIKTNEPRLAIPFFDREGKMTAISLRDYGNSPLKYILVKVNEDSPTVYGLDVINYNEPVKIVEGPLDSLFLDNAIACAGTSFNKIQTLNLPEDRIIIVDNQPKNKEVCNIIHNLIQSGERIVIWPDNIEQKDINDMVMAGVDVGNLISNNVFQNLEAELRFTNWRKC
tara:strand:+ start:2474 stop:3346 length:873 start_codon:yes stop_codon:yes gene_type:complete